MGIGNLMGMIAGMRGGGAGPNNPGVGVLQGANVKPWSAENNVERAMAGLGGMGMAGPGLQEDMTEEELAALQAQQGETMGRPPAMAPSTGMRRDSGGFGGILSMLQQGR